MTSNALRIVILLLRWFSVLEKRTIAIKSCLENFEYERTIKFVKYKNIVVAVIVYSVVTDLLHFNYVSENILQNSNKNELENLRVFVSY